jgi:hypothetical protein
VGMQRAHQWAFRRPCVATRSILYVCLMYYPKKRGPMPPDSDWFADLERLRLRESPNPPAPRSMRPPRPRAGEKFVKGPIPYDWLQRAARLPGHALHVGLQIWFLVGVTQARQVNLSLSSLRGSLGVSRGAAVRGLQALENAHLVQVDRARGRKPKITVLRPDSDNGATGGEQ